MGENLSERMSKLPDDDFLYVRERILELLSELYPDNAMKWRNIDIPKHMIDETVTDILEHTN